MTKSKSTTGPSKAALPALNQATSALNGAYNPGAVQGITDTLTGQIPTVLGQTLNNPALGAASTYDQNMLTSNPDPTTNPLFMKMLQNTDASTTDAVNSGIGTRGLAGGSAQTQLLASQLGKANDTALLSQYNQNIANQGTAATNATSVANSQSGGIQALLQYLSGTAALPTSVAGDYANGIANLWGKSTTTTQSPSLLNSVLGAAGTAAKVASAF